MVILHGDVLEILVENQGRINFGRAMVDASKVRNMTFSMCVYVSIETLSEHIFFTKMFTDTFNSSNCSLTFYPSLEIK